MIFLFTFLPINKENQKMTSQISKETFDEMKVFLQEAITKRKWFEVYFEVYNTPDNLFKIRNFYISGVRGSITFKIVKVDRETIITYEFYYLPDKINLYNHSCVSDEEENSIFIFQTYEELQVALSKAYVCEYHSFCPRRCSFNRISSPKEKCGICHEEKELHLLEETACGHNFCLSCLGDYVRTRLRYGGGRELVPKDDIPCPVCRQDMQLCPDCKEAKFQCMCKNDNDDD